VLPNFLVIGAMKAGTTSLYHYLRCHPQVFMPRSKELNFFVEDDRVGRWREGLGRWNDGLGWYAQQFEEGEGAVALGEASVKYTLYPYIHGVPSRIAKTLPGVRLIYLVRHPIQRMRSHFWHVFRNGRETERSIDKALLGHSSYLDASRYAMQIEQYLEHFPLERILIVKSEDLRDQRETTLERTLTFLGVDSGRMPDNLEREWNATEERRKARPIDSALKRVPGYAFLSMLSPAPLKQLKRRLTTEKLGNLTISDSVRRELEDRLRDDVQRLRRYMGPDFDGWGIA
jgi:sulfotransferase family protein